MEVNFYVPRMQYFSQMDPYLIRLGLYQIVSILRDTTPSINASLIAGFVERWRPETHTFHMPFGEMTVTLQDVSALWGLPIRGIPVGGVSDSRDFAHDIDQYLGADPTQLRADKGKSSYHMQKTELRRHFSAGLTDASSDLEIRR
jgi:hypothetical protein